MAKDILLIDGNSMLFRAYHATAYRGNFMSTSTGVPTNAVFGFSNMINKAITLLDPEYVLVAWDAGKPTFRHKQFEEYKGTRKEVDHELKVQFPIVREFLDAYHIFRYEEEGIEADDIIGSLAKRYPDKKIHILSSDKDLLQLIDDTTDVLLMKKGISDMQLTDAKVLYEMMELTPAQIIDFKGLSGDTSDNIPGVRGIGDKTAIKLLHAYESVEGVYAHIDELKGKQKEKLLEDKDMAFMSKQLATIKTDCVFDFDLDDFKFSPDYAMLNEFYRKYEMNSLIMKNVESKEEKQTFKQAQIITSLNEMDIEENMCVVLDYDNEPYYECALLGMILQNSKGVYYMRKDDMLMDEAVESYFNSDLPKFGYDVKMMYHILKRYGFSFKPFTLDLMIASFTCDNNINNYDKFLHKYGFVEKKSKADIYGKTGKPMLVDEHDKMVYLQEKIQMYYAIKDVILKEIEEKQLQYVLYEIEMPLSYVLFKMEKEGITTSVEVLNDIGNKTLQIIQTLESEIFALVGHEFNVQSPKQLGDVLFDELGLKAGRKRSTAIDVLEKLQNAHPIVPLLIKHRKYQKIYSTYCEGLKKHIQHDGKIHTIFNQCLTQTGRLSSSEPNLQNISTRDEEGKQVRKAFLAQNDNYLYSADYSQIELRVLAHMAKEEKMIEAFKEGLDIHTKTAMEVFALADASNVDSNMRRQAKVVNFGMVYGQSDFGLSEELHITRNEAREFMDRYFASYPGIHQFMEETIQFCKDNGYVMTMFKRRRYIPEINDKNYMTREFGKRAAMNAPIQGSAADLIKLAMIKVDALLEKHNLKSRMILQVHDELVFDVYEEEKDIVEKIVKEGMEQVYALSVPLLVDGGFAKNYYDVK